MEVIIKHSSKKDKKYDAIIDGKKTVSFGAAGASDYTIHKNESRKQMYIDRHKKREVWSKDGIKTAGFYAKNVLWNKPSIQESIKDLNNKYKDIKFKLK